MKSQPIPQTANERIEAEWRQMREIAAQAKPPAAQPK